MDKFKEEKYLQALGARIQALRNNAGMTQEQLARAIGISRVQVARIETSVVKKNNPTIATLLRIADVFSIDITELVNVA